MRTRDLRPGFFKNPDLAALEPWVRLLFAGLWCMADRRGVVEYNLKVIDAELFPYDVVPVKCGIEKLGELGFLLVYSVGGRSAIYIPNFGKHQRPHPKETNNSIPLPAGAEPRLGDNLGCDPGVDLGCGSRTYKKEKKEEKILEVQEGGSGRKPKQDTRRYAEADRSGNPRNSEPDFPNIFLSDAEHHRALARFVERGLKPEFHSDAFQLLNASLSRGNNLRDSVEHYSSLIGWALREALRNQAEAQRTAKLCSPTKETPQDETIRRIREYGRRAGNHGNSGNHSFDVSGVPAIGACHATVVPNVQEDPTRRHPLGFGPFHQDEHRATRTDHQPAFSLAPGDEPGANPQVCAGPRAGGRGAACDAGEASRAIDPSPQEVSDPVRSIAAPGASYGSTSGQASAWRSYR